MPDINITPENLIGLSRSIESGYIQELKPISKWAEMIIINMEHPPSWILDIYDSKVSSEIFIILCDQLNRLPANVWCKIDDTAICLGFSYLIFKRGDINLLDLLMECGRKADSSNYIFDCSHFYHFANQVENINLSEHEQQKNYREIETILRPMAEMAIDTLPRQLIDLKSC